jgi:hypothetical protein
MPRPAATADTAYGSRTLQLLPTSEGLDVWELQIKLIGWGSGTDNEAIGNLMDPVRVTGKFDSTTRDAVMRFQKAHKQPVSGVVDDRTFRAIDAEAALHPVMVWDLRCPCVRRTDDPDPDKLCRCNKHTEKGKCTTGFGKGRFAGKTILEGKKLADATDISGQAVDLHDAKEYDGMDKALLWATRALMHRAAIDRIAVVSGYRCWQDNYLHTDDRRWRHRRLTFHFGKAIEFMHAGRCSDAGNAIEYRDVETGEWTSIGFDYKDKAVCDRCEAIRAVAIAKCGFQLRWQSMDRISVAEGLKTAQPPASPFAVHLNSVRRLGREEDDYVKTHLDAVQPLYKGILGVSMPMDLGAGLNPKIAPSELYFRNTEDSMSGTFPFGASRVWHTGIHLYPGGDTKVHALASGEVVACRVGEVEDVKAFGSRNFVLLRHEYKTKKWFSLYMHMDAGKPEAASTVPWRKALYLRTKDHVDLLAPGPLFELKEVDDKKADGTVVKKKRLLAAAGYNTGEAVEADGAELDPLTLDDQAPKNSKVVKVAGLTDSYVYTQLEGKAVGTRVDKDTTLAAKFDGSSVIALTKSIPVHAGAELGAVAGKAPKDVALTGKGTYLHLETFAAECLATGDGWVTIDASDPTKAADRKVVSAACVEKKLLVEAPDKVLLADDVLASGKNPNAWACRAVALKMPSAWQLDWKAAIAAAPGLSFLKEPDKIGDAFNEYRWWADVSGAGMLPGSEIVYHFHPIAFALFIANA